MSSFEAFTTITWSPASTFGAQIGLCLPRRRCATSVASLPSTMPSASITCQPRWMSDSLGWNVRTGSTLLDIDAGSARARATPIGSCASPERLVGRTRRWRGGIRAALDVRRPAGQRRRSMFGEGPIPGQPAALEIVADLGVRNHVLLPVVAAHPGFAAALVRTPPLLLELRGPLREITLAGRLSTPAHRRHGTRRRLGPLDQAGHLLDELVLVLDHVVMDDAVDAANPVQIQFLAFVLVARAIVVDRQ